MYSKIKLNYLHHQLSILF